VAAYIISRVHITSAEDMKRYMVEAPPTVAAFGGRYLVRGPDVSSQVSSPERMVVAEFDSKERALSWYHSEIYRPLRDLRNRSAEAVILLADGVATPCE
jgi:uncharacterized protein (DUF1330 family)